MRVEIRFEGGQIETADMMPGDLYVIEASGEAAHLRGRRAEKWRMQRLERRLVDLREDCAAYRGRLREVDEEWLAAYDRLPPE